MKSTLHTFSALLVLGICIHFTVQRAKCQHVPNRCSCIKSRNGVLGPFSDFTVTLKRPGCTRDEIIVILKEDNRKVCLSPHGPQGKRLLKCWHRKLEEGKNGKTCMGRLRPRHQKKQRTKSKEQKIISAA
ncbi:hypothetical protein KOW79_002469 [Hemibagrus wyckioides]|uniref:Chemokine interleukin-8-like domain-containing protein n=1 Tax=Hemibagrus wyckioides TaxID=337641 RepID=A0A9D3P406_9TELE|nr:C-X-C motif chemokine 9 [Hemibagrus wyckioides]KAG7334062.1 hypothetical protein KOW79_002469 [Hemibagrus wyckioides]